MAAQRVELVIASDSVNPFEMRDVVGRDPDEMIWQGAPPSPGRRRPSREHVCVFREYAASEEEFAYTLLARMYSRVAPMADGMTDLVGKGCRIKLSVVQELADGSASDGSFVLDVSWIRMLGRVGAVVDVDLISKG